METKRQTNTIRPDVRIRDSLIMQTERKQIDPGARFDRHHTPGIRAQTKHNNNIHAHLKLIIHNFSLLVHSPALGATACQHTLSLCGLAVLVSDKNVIWFFSDIFVDLLRCCRVMNSVPSAVLSLLLLSMV